MEKDKISIIIPIHNGEKYLKRLYNNIKSQTYKNIQIIFVENFSNDNSLELLKIIEKKDCRICVIECKNRGTSLARKKGVEYATGKYTVFMDQDDYYNNCQAIENMYNTIVESDTDICQFSNYKKYVLGKKKKSMIIDQRTIITSEQIKNKEIASVFESYGGGVLTTSVWSKIYLTDLLKDAVNNINISLYFAEDLFLNTCCLLNDNLKKVCIDPNAYYVWDSRYGFSSSNNSGRALIKDYNQVKPIINQMLIKSGVGEEVFYRFHLESLYFMLSYIINHMIEDDKQEVLKLINEMSKLTFIQLAKNYVNNEMKENRRYDELLFLASNYTSDEFYEKFKSRANGNSSLKRMIKGMLKK